MIAKVFTKNNPATKVCDCQYESGKMKMNGKE